MDGKANLTVKPAISLFLVVLVTSVTAGKIIYVDADATGSNNGSSWVDAYNYLQDALSDANDSEKPVEIRVAQGVYKPDQGANQTPGDREATFHLVNGVSLKGGFAGLGAADPNARHTELHEAILSGDLCDNDVDVNEAWLSLVEPTWDDNSYHIVTGSCTDEKAWLDGFTVAAGNANGHWETPRARGAGMYNDFGSPTLANCIFTGNSALDTGGGMANDSGSNPSLTNCSFIRNRAFTSGGGIYNRESKPTLTHCAFNWNSAWVDGGGMSNWQSNPTLSNCTFTGNDGSAAGGGMSNLESKPTLTHCRFTNNNSVVHGGGLYNYRSNPKLTNCTFTANRASGVVFDVIPSGGGMYNLESNPILTNCTFSANLTSDVGGGMYNELSHPTLTNCTFSQNDGGGGGGGMFNDESDPTLNGCIFSGNMVDLWGGGIYNFRESYPVLANCLFTGNSAGGGGAIFNHADIFLRLINCTFAANSAKTGDAIGCDSWHWYDPSNVGLINCILWDEGDEIWSDDGSTIDVAYSNIKGGWPGQGNMDVDPLFADPGSGDYHLKSQAGRWDPETQSWVKDDVTSPCIDAGDPTSPIGHEPFPNGGIINMGAYGGTAEASKSYFGEPVCETIVAGDINGDCRVDFGDFAIMALHWLEDNSG